MFKHVRTILALSVALAAPLGASAEPSASIADHYQTLINNDSALPSAPRIFGDLYLSADAGGTITGSYRSTDGVYYGPSYPVYGSITGSRITLHIGLMGSTSISGTINREGVIEGTAALGLSGRVAGFRAVAT